MTHFYLVYNPTNGRIGEIRESTCTYFVNIEDYIRVIEGERMTYEIEGNVYIIKYPLRSTKEYPFYKYYSDNKRELEKLRKKLLIEKL